MPRNIGTSLDSPPLYRAVILYTYPDPNGNPWKDYTGSDDVTHTFHTVTTAGPYANKGQANARITEAMNRHERRVEHTHRNTYDAYLLVPPATYPNLAGKRVPYNGPLGIPTVTAFVEELLPFWQTVDNTRRTA